jgi:hypothetical protein
MRPGGWSALLLLVASGAQAHGGAREQNPWLEGGQALFADPASLFLLMVLAVFVAQADRTQLKGTLAAGLAGLLLGALLAMAGLVLDLGLFLLTLAFALGLAVAWARPLPLPLYSLPTFAAATGTVLMLAPAVTAGVSFRLAWLTSVVLIATLLFANLLGFVRALLGRKRGPVKHLLVRVAGSWLATAALLAWVLELSRRNG